MINPFRLFLSAVVGGVFVMGCASDRVAPPPPTTSTTQPPFAQLNPGYSLLYKLMSDESDVGKIFFLKSADDSIKSLVKQIGSAAQDAKKKMDFFSKQDNHLRYDTPGLPWIEQRSRDLQAKEDEHNLLMNSKGKNFELRLIFTQLEAMDYARQLCKALDEKETAGNRKRFLQDLANQSAGFSDKLMKMMTVSD